MRHIVDEVRLDLTPVLLLQEGSYRNEKCRGDDDQTIIWRPL